LFFQRSPFGSESWGIEARERTAYTSRGKRSDARIFDLVKICTVWRIVGMAEKKITFRQTTNAPVKAFV
jgi:hypothetical protein